MIGVRAITWIASVLCVLVAYRWTYRRSRLLAAIFACGIIGRALLGVTFFVISAFDLPIMESLQTGDGFWTLAIDARWYFDSAAAAARGLTTIGDVAPSPTYLRVFAAWLAISGISPASAVLFNLLCYVGIVIAIVSMCRSAIGSGIALAAITIDPAFLIFGTQALKDPFCLLALALTLAGVRIWCDGLVPSDERQQLRLSVGLLSIAIGVYVVAGIRPYVAVFILAGLLATAVTSLIVCKGSARWRVGLAHAGMVVLMWGAFASGAGAYYPYYESLVERAVINPIVPILDLDHARALFVSAGGATSFGGSASPPPVAAEGQNEVTGALDVDLGMDTRAMRLLHGLAVLFIPISLLRSMSVVTFSGGRGLLFITDIDTIVIDLTLAACIFVLAKTRPHPSMIPLLAFVAVLSLFTIVVLAYVVTNFGTLFRLRLIAVVAIWLLPALVRQADRPAPVSEVI
jgi:hypothetical protein